MYCKSCGKEISNQASFCPFCGEAAPKQKPASTSGFPSAPQIKNISNLDVGQMASSLQGKRVAGMSVFRLALCILGAVHVLAFFLLSYAKLSGVGMLLGSIMPSRMTAMHYMTFTFHMAEMGMADGSTVLVNTVVCLVPPLMGALILWLGLTRRTAKGYKLSAIAGVVCLVFDVILAAAMSSITDAGYRGTMGGVLACLLSILTVAAAVAGVKLDRSSDR